MRVKFVKPENSENVFAIFPDKIEEKSDLMLCCSVFLQFAWCTKSFSELEQTFDQELYDELCQHYGEKLEIIAP